MLEGKTVLVTGAAKGIGKAIALAFAKQGCNIVLNYRSNVSDDTIKEIEAYNVKCMPLQGDVSDFATAAEIVKKAKKEFGTVDVLVNNAGITKDMLLMRMSEEEFDSVIQTNLKGTFNMIRHVSSVMLKQRSGAIINMSSVVGVTGNAGQANYAASKAGVIGLTKATAKELAARGVTCKEYDVRSDSIKTLWSGRRYCECSSVLRKEYLYYRTGVKCRWWNGNVRK